MKKLIKSFVLAILLINLGLTLYGASASAADVISPLEEINMVGNPDETNLPSYQVGQHPEAPYDFSTPGVGTATSPILFVLDLFRYAISGIAMIMIIVYAFKLVSTSGEEEATKIKNGLIYGILGLLVVQLADIIVKKMFFGDQGQAFENEAESQMFAEDSVSELRGIIGFIEIFLGAIAVLVIIIRGIMVLTGGGEEEALTKAKNHIIYAGVGLAVIGLSELIVRGFIFPAAGEELPDVEQGKHILVMISNYISSFVAIISFLVLFYAGFKYVASAGKEEETDKIRKIFIGATIGLLLSLGAYAAVNTLVKFEEPVDTLIENPDLQETD